MQVFFYVISSGPLCWGEQAWDGGAGEGGRGDQKRELQGRKAGQLHHHKREKCINTDIH